MTKILSPADKILSARTAFMCDPKLAFYSTLLVQMRLVDATDNPAIDTMAVDGEHLFYDAAFVDKLTMPELKFVLAHEVEHMAKKHHIRRGNRDPEDWNKATDYAINGGLVSAGVGKMPESGLINHDFDGMGAEEIYAAIGRQKQQDDQQQSGGTDPGGCGGVMDAAPASDPAAMREAEARVDARVRQAASIAKAAMAGQDIPDHIARLIDELTRPVIDWRALLRRFIDESVITDFSWARPNRRMLAHGLVTPGLVPDGLNHLVIAVDTSGSIDQDALKRFGSEIAGAFGDGTIDQLTVLYADTQVRKVETFERGDEIELSAAGGGGTMFSPTMKWIADNAPNASAVIYLTDLIVNDFGDDPGIPTIWAVYGDSRRFDQLASRAPFGEAVYLAA